MTFGYDAHFASMGPTSVSNITDFAKALLFDMKFGRDEYGQDLDIGQVNCIQHILLPKTLDTDSLRSL